MASGDFHRRDFHKLTFAAMSGAIAGTLSGCKKPGDSKTTEKKDKDQTEDDPSVVKVDPNAHLCRGLNACKGKGRGGMNECAGTSVCASAVAHDCAGHNECKGQGGCGPKPGKNECKGKGHCAVPLMQHSWENARKQLEEKTKKATGKALGAAPKDA